MVFQKSFTFDITNLLYFKALISNSVTYTYTQIAKFYPLYISLYWILKFINVVGKKYQTYFDLFLKH